MHEKIRKNKITLEIRQKHSLKLQLLPYSIFNLFLGDPTENFCPRSFKLLPLEVELTPNFQRHYPMSIYVIVIVLIFLHLQV